MNCVLPGRVTVLRSIMLRLPCMFPIPPEHRPIGSTLGDLEHETQGYGTRNEQQRSLPPRGATHVNLLVALQLAGKTH